MLRTLEKEAQVASVANQVEAQRRVKSNQNRERRFESKLPSKEGRERKVKVIPEVVTPENCRDVLSRVAEPLRDLDYESQLNMKWSKNRDAVAAIKAEIGQESDVTLGDTVASPLTSGYRCVDTFHLGTGVDGHTFAGHFVRSGVAGAVCVPVDNLVNMRSAHKAVCEAYGAAVRQSRLPVCGGRGKQEPGYWRDVHVRSNEAGEVMAVVHFHPQDMEQGELARVKKELAEAFQSQVPFVRSLFFCPSASRHASPCETPAELLYGEEFLEETIYIGDSSLNIKIGPHTTQLLLNSSMAGKYIEALRWELKLKADGNLLHLPGQNNASSVRSGLLAIALAREVSKCFVFGDELELSEAQVNATENGVNNCVFNEAQLNGPLLKTILSETRADSGGTSVLVSAGKLGLDFSVIRALRTHSKIRRIVYVTPRPDNRGPMNNFAALSVFKAGAGKPFKLISAIPVDLFPNTNSCEHILTWTR